ncbi:MAG: aminopeptidase N, partial [Gammaproteobacteria bacterium]|nr:aminopeptidase N [Gammaproteobacteria bacterium]
MAKNATPKTIYLKEYQQPDYWIDQADLRFELGEDETRVITELSLRRNTASQSGQPLELLGEGLQLEGVWLDGQLLTTDDYSLGEESLVITRVPAQFCLKTAVVINPQQNTSLEGLYKSSGNFCTQCEAEGFRKITYYLDRPDVMAKFTTTIVADKTRYPILLSNGNPVASGDEADGCHWVKWEDPFKKPAYLFALVAGNLECIEDHFITRSNRNIALRIYVEKHNVDKCDHAMASLKRCMAWDEEKYGREYDLDIYMIVAVDDFNMGAMENKGLNVFNSKFVLAKQQTATDTDFINIEGVIGHEYFHNWSGNRVTCRDWFQLTLKEGLTVFRDQQFTADMNSATVKRIDDVNVLRTRQFAEDAGPMSHPIQPDSYVEINNFYTVTVYNKGAEIIRMIHTLLGETAFRKGMDLYFDRHDGEAATTEDFLKSMEDASAADLQQFRRWYHQSGTPELSIETEYDAANKVYRVTVRQVSLDKRNKPFHIPLAMALVDANGDDVASTNCVLDITGAEQQFEFANISDTVVPSLLRDFSAPVRLNVALTNDELAFLMAQDNDSFNQWNSAQQLALNIILKLIDDFSQNKTLQLDVIYISAFRQVLLDKHMDKALVSRILTLPSEDYIAEMMDVVDVDAIHQVREFCKSAIATALEQKLLDTYQQNQLEAFDITPDAIGRRSLKNLCLSYLQATGKSSYQQLAMQQYSSANN